MTVRLRPPTRKVTIGNQSTPLHRAGVVLAGHWQTARTQGRSAS